MNFQRYSKKKDQRYQIAKKNPKLSKGYPDKLAIKLSEKYLMKLPAKIPKEFPEKRTSELLNCRKNSQRYSIKFPQKQ